MLGRHWWISRDPIEEQAGNNLYAYVKNRPVFYVDPDGRDGIVSLAWKVAIAAYAAKKAWDFSQGWKNFDEKAKNYQKAQKESAEDPMNADKSKKACEAAQDLPAAVTGAAQNTPGTSMTGDVPGRVPRGAGKIGEPK